MSLKETLELAGMVISVPVIYYSLKELKNQFVGWAEKNKLDEEVPKFKEIKSDNIKDNYAFNEEKAEDDSSGNLNYMNKLGNLASKADVPFSRALNLYNGINFQIYKNSINAGERFKTRKANLENKTFRLIGFLLNSSN